MRWEISLFIAYFLSNISAKNYQNRLMYVEVIACHISVVFVPQCGNEMHVRFVIIFMYVCQSRPTIYTDQRRHFTVLQ